MTQSNFFNRVLKHTATGILFTSSLLVGCQSDNLNHNSNNESQAIEYKNLSLLKQTNFSTIYIDKTIDFGKFKTIYVEPISYSNLTIIQPSNSVYNKSFEFEVKSQQRFSAIYLKSITEQLSNNADFTLVDKPTRGTLILKSDLTELQPNATNIANREPSVRNKIYSEGSGNLTITTYLHDSDSNQVIASIKEKKCSTEFWGENTEISNIRDITSMLNSWSRSIRHQLDELRQIP